MLRTCSYVLLMALTCKVSSEAKNYVKNIYDEEIRSPGYYLVATIPAGAESINFTDTSRTGNFLGVKLPTGRFIFTGDHHNINSSNEYIGAGTKFYYNHGNDYSLESFSTAGPLNTSIDVILIHHHGQPKIAYQYQTPDAFPKRGPAIDLPEKLEKSRISQPSSDIFENLMVEDKLRISTVTPRKKRRRKYSWQNVGFTKCSKPCGGGFQTRRYICVRQRSRKHVDNNFCKLSLKPSDHMERCNTKPCAPQWESSQWSECSATCGNGSRHRKLQCMQKVSDKLQIKVDDVNCVDLPEPTIALEESCHMPSCNIYTTPRATSISVKHFEPPTRWKVEEWTPCSAKCGNGTRTRVVTCVTFGKICNMKEKPVTEENCKVADCDNKMPETDGISDSPHDSSWLYSAWPEKCSAQCGIGTLSRRLYCESFLRNKTCDEENMPLLNRTCSNGGPCGQWFIGPWTECSSSCDIGIETREVVCVSRFLGSLKVVHGGNCRHDKPIEKRSCMGPPCNATWFMSDWSECSRRCGRGIQKREVRCIGPDGIPMNARELECDENEKPIDWRNCNEQPCNAEEAEETNSVGGSDDQGSECEDRLTDCWRIRQVGKESGDKCQRTLYKKGCCKACRYYSFLRSNG